MTHTSAGPAQFGVQAGRRDADDKEGDAPASRRVLVWRASGDAVECFDDDHLPAMARRALPEGMPGEVLVAVAVVLCGSADRRLGNRHAEQVAAVGELLRSVAVAEESVIADGMEVLGQNV